jgi:hypothetical protein
MQLYEDGSQVAAQSVGPSPHSGYYEALKKSLRIEAMEGDIVQTDM